MKRKINYIVLVAVALFCFISCSTFIDNSYKTLYIAGQTYDAGMKSVADLQKQGKITDVQRIEINKYAEKYYACYQVAVVALQAYKKSQNEATEQALATALTEMINSWTVFAKAVNAFAPNLIPTEVK